MKLFLVLIMSRVFSLVHPRVAPALARPLAALVWVLSPRLRKVSLKNLSLCYPDMLEADRRNLARRAMRHYVRTIFESGISWHWSRERFYGLFEKDAGGELCQQGMDRGKGVMVLAPHHGAWEFLGLQVTGKRGGQIMYKPGDDATLEARLVESRERFGATLLPANSAGIKSLLRSLRSGGIIGVLPDQEPKRGDGQFAPFFGIPALTGVLACRLAQRTGATVVFASCLREPGGRYRVHFLPSDPGIGDPDIDIALAALNRGVERCIALAPEQYLWGYKRFRQRPDGEARFY